MSKIEESGVEVEAYLEMNPVQKMRLRLDYLTASTIDQELVHGRFPKLREKPVATPRRTNQGTPLPDKNSETHFAEMLKRNTDFLRRVSKKSSFASYLLIPAIVVLNLNFILLVSFFRFFRLLWDPIGFMHRRYNRNLRSSDAADNDFETPEE